MGLEGSTFVSKESLLVPKLALYPAYFPHILTVISDDIVVTMGCSCAHTDSQQFE